MGLPLLASLAPPVAKTIYGLFGALEFGNKPRPFYSMPQSVTDAESIYQFLSGADMAGKKEAETNIFQSQANTLDTLQQGVSDSSALLNTAPQVQSQTNQALSGLAVENARQKMQAQGTYANFLQGTKAQYEDKMWQWNEAEPYLNEAKAKEEATQNLFGGIKDIGAGAMDIFSANQINELTGLEKDKIKLMRDDLKLRAEQAKINSDNKVTSNSNDNLAVMQEEGVYAPQETSSEMALNELSDLTIGELIAGVRNLNTDLFGENAKKYNPIMGKMFNTKLQ